MKVGIFASGAGSNADSLLPYLLRKNHYVTIVTNKSKAGVLSIAEKHGVESIVIDKTFQIPDFDLIILAGFLWKIPKSIVDNNKGKIVNIHPSLLPKYGGVGMWGDKVHTAVKESGDRYSGITVHWVDSEYDTGDIIFQTRCPVYSEDSVEVIRKRVQGLEHTFYPMVVERLITDLT